MGDKQKLYQAIKKVYPNAVYVKSDSPQCEDDEIVIGEVGVQVGDDYVCVSYLQDDCVYSSDYRQFKHVKRLLEDIAKALKEVEA
jgi:hypothetical protein